MIGTSDAVRWLVKTGAHWRYLPNDFPPWPALYQQARRWLAAGCFEAMAHDLREVLRVAAGRTPSPTAAVLDGREMKARGFVQELAEEGDFDAALQDLVRQVTLMAPQAARLNKRTLRAQREQHDPVCGAAALDVLAGAYRYAPAAEHREGIAAFLAKRPPVF
jgi:hypothetical protein